MTIERLLREVERVEDLTRPHLFYHPNLSGGLDDTQPGWVNRTASGGVPGVNAGANSESVSGDSQASLPPGRGRLGLRRVGCIVGAAAGGLLAASLAYLGIRAVDQSAQQGGEQSTVPPQPSETLAFAATLNLTSTPEAMASIVPATPEPPTIAPATAPTQTATPLATEPVIPAAVSQERYEGEFSFNEILKNTSQRNVWETMVPLLQFEFSIKDQLGGIDSLLTSLTNPFIDSDAHVTDPTVEPGLGHTDVDMRNYEHVLDIVRDADSMAVNELVNWNTETGLATFGFYGDAHDVDALTLLAAIGTLYTQEPEKVTVQVEGGVRWMTVEEAWSAQEIRQDLLELQVEIIGETQEEFIGEGLSFGEITRRANTLRNDASWQIPDDFRSERDQHRTCDRFRQDEGQGTRMTDDQMPPREVEHVESGEETFTEANIERDQILFAGTVRMSDGIWDVDRFTARGYRNPEGGNPNQIFSAVGEEELPCGELEVFAPQVPTLAPTFTASPTLWITPTGTVVRITPTGSAIAFTPTPTGVVVTTYTPTPRATENPTATPQNSEPTGQPQSPDPGTPVQPATPVPPPPPPATPVQPVATPTLGAVPTPGK